MDGRDPERPSRPFTIVRIDRRPILPLPSIPYTVDVTQ